MKYVLGRLGQGLVVIWAAFSITFVILYLLPSDPVEIMLSQGGDSHTADPEAVERLRQIHGLDRNVVGQYAFALGRALKADFGHSIVLGEPVIDLVLDVLPQTMLLAACAGAIATALGLLIALAAIATRSEWLRAVLVNLPSLWVSLPTFWVGILLIQLVSFQWGLLPAVGNSGWRALVLPALTLALPTAALVAQVLYNNLRDVIAQPFVQVLRAKGVRERTILLRHALRIACIPAVTLVGLNVASMLAGAIVIETAFSRSGLGRLTEGAVKAQDIPLVQGIVVVSAVIFIVVNFAVDVLYPLLDPRIAQASARRLGG